MGKKEHNPMVELGLKVAERVLEHETDAGRSAAILLLIALDSAYNSVLAVCIVKMDLLKVTLLKLLCSSFLFLTITWKTCISSQKMALARGSG